MAGIFISYRRDDVAGQAGRLFGRLSDHYGEDAVFMDVESLNPGERYEDIIKKWITDCDVMLMAIGRRWIAERERLADPNDFVRLEIDTAQAARRRIVPLLVDCSDLPARADLPPEVADAFRNQSWEIRHRTFDRDVDALIVALEREGIRAPSSATRHRVASALGRAGWPYTWVAGVLRLGPWGALALLVLAVGIAAAVAGRLAYQAGFARGSDKGAAATTASYEEQLGEQKRGELRIPGFVTNGVRGVPNASIHVSNRKNGKVFTTESGVFGRYEVDLKELEIAEGDIVRLEVTIPNHAPVTEDIKYRDGFREFRSIVR